MKKDKAKEIRKPHKNEMAIVRSSAAEYLTFVAASGSGGVEAVYADESIWLSQKMMATLYDVNVREPCSSASGQPPSLMSTPSRPT